MQNIYVHKILSTKFLQELVCKKELRKLLTECEYE